MGDIHRSQNPEHPSWLMKCTLAVEDTSHFRLVSGSTAFFLRYLKVHERGQLTIIKLILSQTKLQLWHFGWFRVCWLNLSHWVDSHLDCLRKESQVATFSIIFITLLVVNQTNLKNSRQIGKADLPRDFVEDLRDSSGLIEDPPDRDKQMQAEQVLATDSGATWYQSCKRVNKSTL